MTVANKITIFRIFLSLFFFAMLWMNTKATVLAAMAIFAVAALSDAVDGEIARRTKTTTDFGAIADPFADKILVMAAFIAFASMKEIHVPLWGVFIILLRELAISTLRALAALRGKVMKADRYAKFKTMSQMISAGIIMILLLLVKLSEKEPFSVSLLNSAASKAAAISFWLTVLVAVVTLASGVVYLVNNYKILRASWSHKADK